MAAAYPLIWRKGERRKSRHPVILLLFLAPCPTWVVSPWPLWRKKTGLWGMLGCSHTNPVLTPALENMVEHKLTSLASTAACIISVQPLNVACNEKYINMNTSTNRCQAKASKASGQMCVRWCTTLPGQYVQVKGQYKAIQGWVSWIFSSY